MLKQQIQGNMHRFIIHCGEKRKDEEIAEYTHSWDHKIEMSQERNWNLPKRSERVTEIKMCKLYSCFFMKLTPHINDIKIQKSHFIGTGVKIDPL